MTLLEQIRELEKSIRNNERAIEAQRNALRALEAERVDCPHEFSSPVKGYEHEGGTCKLCGINEIYADTLNWKKRTGRLG